MISGRPKYPQPSCEHITDQRNINGMYVSGIVIFPHIMENIEKVGCLGAKLDAAQGNLYFAAFITLTENYNKLIIEYE